MVTTTPRFSRASQGQTYVSAARFLCFNESCFEREYLLNTRLMWVLICVSRSNHFEKKYFGKGRAVWVPPDSCVSRKVSQEEKHVKAGLMSILLDACISKKVVWEKRQKHRIHVSAAQFVCLKEGYFERKYFGKGQTMWVPPNFCVTKVLWKGVRVRPDLCQRRPIRVCQSRLLWKGHMFKDGTYAKYQAVLVPLDSRVSKKVDLKRTYV